MKNFLIIGVFFLSLNSYGLEIDAAERFFSDPDMVSAQLSPNGKLIVAITYSEGVQQLVLMTVPVKITANTQFNHRKVLLDVAEFTENKASLRAIQWIDNNNVAVSFSENKAGIKDLVETHKSHYMLIARVPSGDSALAEIYSVKTRGRLIDALPYEDDSFLYATYSAYSKVYKIKPSLLSMHKFKPNKLSKIDGGQFIKNNEVASVKGYASEWFVDDKGVVEAVLNYGKRRSLVLNAISAEGSILEVKKWTRDEIDEATSDNYDVAIKTDQDYLADNHDIKKLIMPVTLSDEKDFFYAFDYAESERRSVYKVNYKTGSKKLIYESDSFRIVDIFLSHDDRHLNAVSVIKDGDIRYVYLDQFTNNDEREPGAYTSTISESINRQRRLVYKESHNQPGEFFYIHESGESIIGRLYPLLNGPLDNQLYQGNVLVEGLNIPYLLSVPTASNKAWPLIVMPHGGPIGIFDSAHFDDLTQFINARGYAVLRVNYRGSGGHTQSFKEHGKKQWGGLILEDIDSAAKHVLLRKDIDSSKVCLLGMSYGGYAATMLLIDHPNRYHCGVNISGVSDINLMINSPYMSPRNVRWAKSYIGDPITDYEHLKSQSPAYRLDQLQRPLLIMHGQKDTVVSIEHAYRLKLGLEKFNKPFEWYFFPDMAHQYDSVEEQIELFSKAMGFIDQNLLTH